MTAHTRPPTAHPRRRRLRTDPARALSIDDLRHMALHRLPRVNAEYLEGGAEEEHTLRENREAFESVRFAPRVLRDVATVDLGRTIFGQRHRLPFGIAPTGFNGLLWHQGDQAIARAAAQANIPFCQSTVSNQTVSDCAGVKGLTHWFQLYLYGDESTWSRLIADAEKARCQALVLTVDSPVHGHREWDRRNYRSGFTPNWSSKIDMLCHPRWMWQVMRHGLPSFPNLAQFLPEGQRDLYSVATWALSHQVPRADWSTLARVRALWPGRLLIKGVGHLEDIRLARDAGLDGVVLSNHGGRQLDRAISPLHHLRQARQLVGPDFTLLVDSGFRRGADIIQALAMGATGVLLGRAMLYGLAAGGYAGVTRAIELLTAEMSRTMALLGVRSVDELNEEVFA
ncbi:MAG: alpha-hydroxy-acid oxidizing protein [Rhodoferax sp.]|nr:alpha-hydroxy-acid oxidizing protein [Rhodoferax sp.]